MSKIYKILDKMPPTFSTAQFSAAQQSTDNYSWQTLNRLKGRGEIINIRRGWWAKRDAMPEQAACMISYPCYISFHSALYLHGLTTQMPNIIQLAVRTSRRDYECMGMRVKHYRLPATMFNGFHAKDHMMIARPYKAFADCLKISRACPEVVLKEALEGVDESLIKGACDKNMLMRLKRVRRHVG